MYNDYNEYPPSLATVASWVEATPDPVSAWIRVSIWAYWVAASTMDDAYMSRRWDGMASAANGAAMALTDRRIVWMG